MSAASPALARFENWFWLILIALIGLVGIVMAEGGKDAVFSFHGVLFFAAAAIAVMAAFSATSANADRSGYNEAIIKWGVWLAVFWGLAGFLVGLVIALQLAIPALNLDLPWTAFGRLRPLHTSAVIFAFGGTVLLTTSFHVVQRTSGVRLAGRWAPWFVLWGYQLFIVIAATGYILGVTQSKEYAEPEWYADLWLTIVWVV